MLVDDRTDGSAVKPRSRVGDGTTPAPSVANVPGASLELRGLSKSFGREAAVRAVNLTVNPGEFVTLLGPSGSGKTTTLNMIIGFADPDRGDILMNGEQIANLPTHKRNIGMVFQNYALFPHMRVADNIAFPLRQRRCPKSERNRRVAEVLERVRLEEYGHRYPHELSGGQQQRVALARAMVFGPQLLLMDEPLGALDKKLREWLQLEIRRIHQELGITFVYVTHDQEEALVLSDRIAVFNEGVIEQCGSPEQLYEYPKTVFVADFLGESNIFRGRIEQAGSATSIKVGDVILSAPESTQHLRGKSAAMMVRPERVAIRTASSSGEANENSLDGVVGQVIYLGSERRTEVRLDSGEAVLVSEKAGAHTDLSNGDRVQIFWKVDDAVVLSDEPPAEN